MTWSKKILVRQVGSSGSWSSPATTSYTAEAHLQAILVEDPGQIPGVSGDALAVAEMDTLAGPADVCAVDTDGTITVVECKLASNPERRRMVIGQVLDYASAIWMDGFERFAARWGDYSGGDLSEYLSPESMTALRANIEDCRIHLCLAVDDIDDDLRRLVEYLNNTTASDVRVTALQLAYASHDGLEILIPTTFGGELAEAKHRSARSAPPVAWTWPAFVEAIRADAERALAEQYLARLHSLTERHGTHDLVWYGSNPDGGIFLHPYGVEFAPIQLWVNSAGHLMVYGNWSAYTRIAGHDAFARLAQLLGQDHTKGYRGVRADSLDIDQIWNEALRVALELSQIDGR